MSSRTKKKTTLAQLRADTERRLQCLLEGEQLADDVKLLIPNHPGIITKTGILHTKANIRTDLGHHTSAAAALRQTDELFAPVAARGELVPANQEYWRELICRERLLYIGAHQLESTKSCFMRLLAWPGLSPKERMSALHGMAQYHKERKEWIEVTNCCEKALPLLPAPTGSVGMVLEQSLLLLLADAAEAQGDLMSARDFDEKAKKVWFDSGETSINCELADCYRREAFVLLMAGRVKEAVQVLHFAPDFYMHMSQYTGIRMLELNDLRPVMDALKILAEALVQGGIAGSLSFANRIQADVEETEAILIAYGEAVSEETRRELAEQQAAAEAAAAVVAEGQEPPAVKKNKAAKRKQQKRKAQQRKKAAEVVEATAAAAARGEACIEGQQEHGQEEHGEGQNGVEEDETGNEDEGGNQRGVSSVVAAVAEMGVGEKKGQEEEEEEEEDCSVCLNVIDSTDTTNLTGPPLVCGHRYHAFCLRFWVEKCTSKCIEPTCPYCRAPLQEMESA